MRRRIAVSTMLAAAVGVVAAGLVALGLVRSAYDGQARKTLHQEAVLISNLIDTRPAVAAQVASAAKLRAERISPDGRPTRAGLRPARLAPTGLDPADVSAAAAGEELATVRRLKGIRYLVEVQPVAGGGGVIVAQPLSEARAVTSGVLRKLALALAIGLGTAALIGVALARRLAQPLARAADAAHRLADGERSLRLAEDGPDEIADLSHSLNALAQALTKSEAREREFLLSVSHELRTPLTGIRGFAEAISEGVTDPRQASRTIEVEAGRMQRLVADLLDLARAGADDFRLDLSTVDLGGLVREGATIWRHRCAEEGVIFSVELPNEPVLVHTDPGRIRQVLDGLAENALRVTPSGRPIVFCVQPGGVLQVRDGGPGLSAEDLSVAFERSVLYDRYRGVRQVGTGLGLALVGALVHRLGGRAQAGHGPEGGACFTVRLPAAPVAPSTIMR
jgi:two-component system sensor histidine kinase BaeS